VDEQFSALTVIWSLGNETVSFHLHSGHEYVFVPCCYYPAYVAALQQTDPLYKESYLLLGIKCVLSFWRSSPQLARASSFTRFLDHTQRRTTLGRTPLVEWSARHRDLYLTTHKSHNGQTSIPPGGIRTYNSIKREVADLRLRKRDHWDWPGIIFRNPNNRSPWVVLVCSSGEQNRGEHRNVHKILYLYTGVCVFVYTCQITWKCLPILRYTLQFSVNKVLI
jgi:hypothetical protein